MSDPPRKSHGRLSISASVTPRDLMSDRPELKGAWEARVITLFPEAFPGTLGLSLTGKALSEGLWRLRTVDLRQFGEGKHRNVDDTPAGGGAGMVLRADVLGRAITHTQKRAPEDRTRWPLLCLSPRGRPLDQSMARRFSEADGLTLICGRFEGIDERVIEHFSIEEVSLGDFVMTGGEIAAQALIDAAVRLRPGILGNAASTADESFSRYLLEYPQYTRPSDWEGRKIPEVLTSGDHGKVAAWREERARKLTQLRRPDLYGHYLGTLPDDEDPDSA